MVGFRDLGSGVLHPVYLIHEYAGPWEIIEEVYFAPCQIE
jgi:hypothetical protein